jgi:hypothetical protein
MSTGDEPQLGGRSDDNAPMISSVLTRVIVSARGAYTVGNLDELVKFMTSEQRLTYQCVIICQILSVVEAEISRAALFNPEVSTVISTMQGWLDDPTRERAQQLWRQQSLLDGDASIELALYNIIYSIYQPQLDFVEAVRSMITHGKSVPSVFHKEVLHIIIADWQLAAAWAVIQGAGVPSPPDTDDAALEIYLQDVHWCYEKRKLPLLMRLLSTEQLNVFRTMILQQSLWLIKNGFSADQWLPEDQTWIDKASAWLIQSEPLTLAQYLNDLEDFDDYREQSPHREPITLLMMMFDPDRTSTGYQQNFPDMAVLLTGFAETSAPALNIRLRPGVMQKRNIMAAWQVEAAWAILHDQPIPPLEST